MYIKRIVDLTEEIGQATIPYVKKDEMRNVLKNLKKSLDDKDRALKAAVANNVLEKAKDLAEANPNAQYLVCLMEAYNNTKALDSALKQVHKVNKDTAALFVSVDPDSKKIFSLAAVPKSVVEKGLKANEWIQHISHVMGGKGGGKPESAQASGSNYEKVDEVLKLAQEFAATKLA